MSKLLEQLNLQQEHKLENMYKEKGDFLAKYEDYLREKKKFEVVFTASNKEGALSLYDENGVQLILPMEELQKSDRYYDAVYRHRYIGVKRLEVAVKEIDRDTNSVVLKNGRATVNTLKQLRYELMQEVRKSAEHYGTNDYKPYVIYGTIDHVDKLRMNAYVRIFNQPIMGVLYVDKWSDAFTRTLPEGIENDGMPRQFDLIGTRRENGSLYFTLSAKAHNENPWEKIPEEFFDKGSLIVVHCIEALKTKKNWWGAMDGIDIELLGNYTPKFHTMDVGCDYLCTLKQVDTGIKKFIVTPFRQLTFLKNEVTQKAIITKDDIRQLELQKLENEKSEETKEPVMKEQATETMDNSEITNDEE